MLALELSLFNLYSFLNQNNVDNNCPPLPREETSAKLRTFALIVCAQHCCAGNATVMSRITSRISHD